MFKTKTDNWVAVSNKNTGITAQKSIKYILNIDKQLTSGHIIEEKFHHNSDIYLIPVHRGVIK